MSIVKKKVKKIIGVSVAVMGAAFGITTIVAKLKKGDSTYKNAPDQKNPMAGKKVVFVKDDNYAENADGVRGHLEAVGESEHNPGFYEKHMKRTIDVILSFGGLVVLSPVYALISIAIIVDDPGPVLFTQKRVGQNKEYFKLHKFRSMRMSTPHDVPTHMLENPDQYITRVGKFLRKHSLDELPQIWDIFVGNMSVIGPRPGLWNQDVLTAERDKYGANDVKPGLTGWAQINGRDELEIADKAKLDGEYVKNLGLGMDIKCFLGSLHVFGKDDSVVEGGTGEMKKVGRHYTDGKSPSELIGQIGFSAPVTVDRTATKKVLITGAGSYIGESFEAYAEEHYKDNFGIEAVDMVDPNWRKTDFSQYDIVYHVAGIAHADVGNVDDATKEKYYAVNTDLAVEVCKIAKKAGVKEFVFMSSMIVYGKSAGYGNKKVIDRNSVPQPANFYGDSKLQADVAVRGFADENFTVIVLRPPMIYGKGSKGNYPMLAKLAKKLPIFPDVDNQRSMLHIDNLCEFLCQTMLVESMDQAVVLIPQNGEWTKTSQMVQEIAKVSGKKIKLLKVMKPAIALGGKVPGKVGGLVNKAFGNMTYDQEMCEYSGLNYRVTGLKESIKRTEGQDKKKPRALVLASVASMIDQFNMDNINILLNHGYEVDVVADFEKPGNISADRAIELQNRLTMQGVTVYHVPIPRSLSHSNDIIVSYRTVKKLCDERQYEIVHCHSPIGGVVARLAARSIRKSGCKVIYTAHGFHFYDGAPKKNWMLFYPIEKHCSHFTDVLITINEEDYYRAKDEFYARKVIRIPGVGIDTDKYRPFMNVTEKCEKKREIGVPEDAIMILSVGELNDNKNHQLVLRAVAEIGDRRLHYVLVGVGKNYDMLKTLAKELGIENYVHFLGYRTDIAELNNCADIFAFASKREGLGMASLEALACGVPIIGMNTRGIREYVMNGITGYLFEDDVNSCKSALRKLLSLLERDGEKLKENCRKTVKKYSFSMTHQIMETVYTECNRK